MIEAFPLQWPKNWARTDARRRRHSSFKTNRAQAISHLLNELKLLGAKKVVINSNLRTYERGGQLIPYAQQPEASEDPGVAVYFELEGRQQCIPSDRWKSSGDNIRAVGLTIQALRGLERWGAKQMVEAAFTGFQALPDYTENVQAMPDIPDYFDECETPGEIRERYLFYAKELHPDHGGNAEEFKEMLRQYQEKMSKVRNPL